MALFGVRLSPRLLVDAVIRLLDEPAAHGEAFNIGVRHEISMLDLAREVVLRTGSASEVRLVSYEDAFGPGFEDMRRRVPDVTKLTALTGWAPTRSLGDILDETIAHARAEHVAAAVVAQAVR